MFFLAGVAETWPFQHWRVNGGENQNSNGLGDHRMGWTNWCPPDPNGGQDGCNHMTEAKFGSTNYCWYINQEA